MMSHLLVHTYHPCKHRALQGFLVKQEQDGGWIEASIYTLIPWVGVLMYEYHQASGCSHRRHSQLISLFHKDRVKNVLSLVFPQGFVFHFILSVDFTRRLDKFSSVITIYCILLSIIVYVNIYTDAHLHQMRRATDLFSHVTFLNNNFSTLESLRRTGSFIFPLLFSVSTHLVREYPGVGGCPLLSQH